MQFPQRTIQQIYIFDKYLLNFLRLIRPVMIGNKSYSMRLTNFMVGFRKLLASLSLNNPSQYFQMNKLKNPGWICNIQLLKLIQAVHKVSPQNSFNSSDVIELYKELCDGWQEIDLNIFLKIYQQIVTKIPKQPSVNQKGQDDKKKQQQEKERKNKIVRMGLKKLQTYIIENDPMELFAQCDADDSGKLDPHQFNKWLQLTEIKEFTNRQIRHILTTQIFSYFPSRQMSKDDFIKFFKIPKEKVEKKKSFDFFIPPQKVIPFQPPKKSPKQPEGQNKTFNQNYKKPEDKKFISKTPQKKNQSIDKNNGGFKKKNAAKQDIPQPKVFPPKIQQKQNGQLNQNFTQIFPEASIYYRNGSPVMEQLRYFQELQNLIVTHKKYRDSSNPQTPKGKYSQASNFFKGLNYRLFDMAQSVLQREKSRIGIAREIQPKDIIQGELGDCYFLSSIASLISIYPEIISEKFVFNQNPANYFVVKFFLNGEWKYITTDDLFPSSNGKDALFARPHGREIWVMILEKCWAKCFSSYQNIVSGSPKQAFCALSGAPTQYLSVKSKQVTKQLIEQKIKHAYEMRYVVTASGSEFLEKLSEKQQESIGLISNHAYSFLKFINANGTQLVKVRNPWGSRVWKGEWSFESKNWTKQLRDKFNYNKCPQDGSFYMTLTDFLKYFGSFVICQVNPIYTHSSLRMTFKNHKSNYTKIKVSETGKYLISLYQDNERSMKLKYQNFRYSPARVIVMKTGNKWEYVDSCQHSEAYSVSVEVDLVEGAEYIVSGKFTWRHWQEREGCLTVYGPDKVEFETVDRDIAPVFKMEMIESFFKKNRGKTKDYNKIGCIGAYSESLFSLQKGIGYYFITNPTSEKSFQLTYSLGGQGVKVIKPNKLPFEFNLKKGSRFLKGFFTSPEGFNYQASESMSYY